MQEIKCSVQLGRLRRIVKNLDREKKPDETELSFEFILANLFPRSWQAMQEALKKEHTLGFAEGMKWMEEHNDVKGSN
jgi:hypothetical protein